MARDQIATVDFETFPIQRRPDYPPKPAGVAIWEEGKQPIYCAWGHPTNNGVYELDATGGVRRKKVSGNPEEYAKKIMAGLWTKSNVTLLGHNSDKFDWDVAETHMGLPYPGWERRHDSMYQLFLVNPHARKLALKPAAEEHLGMPPEERDEVIDWLVEHQPIPGIQLSRSEQSPKYAGIYIAYAPGDIVGKYAIGDVVRTRKLHDKLFKEISDDENPTGGQTMLDAYNRERRIAPLFLANEREGMRVDVNKLEQDIAKYAAEKDKADAWLQKRLGNPELNVDSDREWANALDSQGIVTDWVITKSGQKSVSKDNLTKNLYKDLSVWGVKTYRDRLATALGTFMNPWLELATHTGGFIYTNWNQVRGDAGGTRTGRPSTYDPNFLNIPKSWGELWEELVKALAVASIQDQFAPLPLTREYILPDPGHLFGHRDYNQQEFRILAHFEDGILMKSYLDDPFIDYHDNMQGLVATIAGMELDRRTIKTLNFGINYGMGIGKLALRLDVAVHVAKTLLAAQRKAAPGVEELNRNLCAIGKRGDAIRTWGGRLYYCEPPGWSEKFKKQMSLDRKSVV